MRNLFFPNETATTFYHIPKRGQSPNGRVLPVEKRFLPELPLPFSFAEFESRFIVAVIVLWTRKLSRSLSHRAVYIPPLLAPAPVPPDAPPSDDIPEEDAQPEGADAPSDCAPV